MLKFWLSLSLSLGPALSYASRLPADDSDKIEDVEIKRFVPHSAKKNKEEKIIDFTMTDPKNPDEKINAQFQYDPSENRSLSDIRVEINKLEAEAKRQYDFTRVFFGLPENVDPAVVLDLMKRMNAETKKELGRQYQLKFKTKMEVLKDAVKRLNTDSLHGFGAQSILFAIAIGAVMQMQLLTDFAADPLSMSRHLDSLTDPISHLAFYSFMAANGFTSDMLLRKYGGVSGRVLGGAVTAQTMRMAIPYLGMSAGMLVSNFTAEVAGLLKMCASKLLKKNSENANPMAGGGPDACEIAQKEFFNMNNKVEQYIPMLLSMAVSTGALTLVHKGYNSVAAKVKVAKPVTPTAAAVDVERRLAGPQVTASQAMKMSQKISRPVFKFIGVRLAASITPVGWVFHGITVATVIKSVAQNAGFVWFDHVLNPIMSKSFAQIWRAGDLKNIDNELKPLILENQAKAYKMNADDNRLEESLKKMQEQMTAWRQINHFKFFNGIQIWTKLINDLGKEFMAAENYYGAFVSEIFNAAKSVHLKQTSKEEITDARKNFMTMLPYRPFPLYGVKPTGHASCEIDPDACVTEENLYWFHPDEMEEYQMNTINEYVEKLQNTITQVKPQLTGPEAKELLADLNKIEATIGKIKTAKNSLEVGKVLVEIKLGAGVKTQKGAMLVNAFLEGIGENAHPVFVEGMMLPTLYTNLFPKIFESIEDKSLNGFSFGNYAEYLMYQMLCGPESTKSSQVLSHTKGFTPKFSPPRITMGLGDIRLELTKPLMDKYNSGPAGTFGMPSSISLCQPLMYNGTKKVEFRDFFYAKAYPQGKKEATSLIRLYSQIQSPILGDWKDTRLESTSQFTPWWNAMMKPVFLNLMNRLDYEFQGLLGAMVDGLDSEKLFGVDSDGKLKRTQVSRSLLKSTNQEFQVYMTILGDMENQLDAEAYKTLKTKTSLQKSMTLFEEMNMGLYVRTDSQKELMAALNPLYKALREMKRAADGRVNLNMSSDELRQIQDALTTALKNYSEHIKGLKLSDYQRKIADLCVQGATKSVGELTGYLLYTQLTKFSSAASLSEKVSENEGIRSNNQDMKVKGGKANPRGQ